MIRINLLPVRAARRREAVQRHLFLLGVGLTAIIVVGLFTYMQDARRLKTIADANRDLENQIAELKLVIGQVDEYKEQESLLAKKLGVIQDLKDKKTGPVRMLDRIATEIPDKLWLTELDEQEQKVTLKGVAINNEVIATFMSRLEDSNLFTEVYLVSIERETVKDLNLKRFTITSKLIVARRSAEATEG
ncbi:MAG: PilN domain-containing protein [Myxococcota bacterium]|nr:PilN domain-containing protein [Myxococcota bacterium]